MAEKEQKKKSNPIIDILKKWGFLIVIILVLIKINKTLFFLIIFSVLTYLGKYIRGMFGLKLVVLDPLHFCTIMTANYLGIKEAIILVAINTIIVDFATQIASDGTFANFFLFSSSAVASVFLLGNMNAVVYCSFAGLLYAVGYYIYRTIVPTQASYEVISKCVTSFMFTFLYSSFFGPLMKILMTL
jgi:hypothetical protein